MYVWLVGYRYLLSRRISWVSVAGVTLGMAALFIVDSVMNGFITESRRAIRGRMADIVLTPGSSALTYELVSKALARVEGLGAMSPRLNRPVLYRVEGGEDLLQRSVQSNYYALQVIGIDFPKENAATEFGRFLKKPAIGFPPLDPNDPFRVDRRHIPPEYRNADPMPLLVGERVVENLNLQPYTILKIVTFPDAVDFEHLQSVSKACVVVGTFKTDDYRFDVANVLVPIDKLHSLIDAQTDAHEICVSVKPGYPLPEMKHRILQEFDRLGLRVLVETWEDKNHNWISAVDNERTILNVILFFIVVVALFLVFATLSMMVTDKIKDIGILSSMGATPGGIAGIFVACGSIVVTFGLLCGSLLGYLVTVNVNAIRVFLQDKFGLYIFRPDVYVFTELPTQIDPPRLCLIAAAVFLLGILSSMIPAVRASYLDPVRALRYE